ncbi:MAG TPA: tetratricopeptide repeat protein [Thermomicrobiales bacterium]|nr:tetratricopeptide repeat protein [Thermomicrobiales bacterium]
MLEQFSRWLRRYQGTEANPIYRLAVDVATGRMSFERALDAAESHSVNGRLADGDLVDLDQQVESEARVNLQFALILARLNAATARAKGFEKVLVDLYLRIAELLEDERDEAEREYNYREALHVAKRISYVAGQRRALNRLARMAFERGDTEDARGLLLQQLEAGREESDTGDEIETAILLADISLADGDVSTAHDLYHRAARSARRIGFHTGAVDALLRQVGILRERGDLHASLQLLRQASESADRTVDTALQAEIAFRTGALMRELNMPEEATERLTIALQRARTLGDMAMEARSLLMLAQLEQRMGRDEQALQHYEAAVGLERGLGNRGEVARALQAMGEIHLAQDRPSAAISVLTEAREMVLYSDDTELLMQVHGMLGKALADQGREREALDALQTALASSRALDDPTEEARWIITVAEVMLRTGETDNAGELAQRAEQLARGSSNNVLRAAVYSLNGQVALVDRRLQDAEDAFASATAASRAAGQSGASLRYLPLLSRLAAELGDMDGAIRYLDEAVAEAQAVGEDAQACMFHGQAARLLGSAGRIRDAEERYQRALALGRSAGDPRLSGRALQGLAAIYDTTGQLELAIEHYYDALDAANRAGDARTIASTHFNLGALLVDEERDDEARTHLERARDAAATLNDYALAERARTLLDILAPPSSIYRSLDEQSTDMPLSEEPSRPRQYPPLH